MLASSDAIIGATWFRNTTQNERQQGTMEERGATARTQTDTVDDMSPQREAVAKKSSKRGNSREAIVNPVRMTPKTS